MMMEPKIRFINTENWNCLPFSELAVRKSSSAISEEQPFVEYEDIISGEGTLNKDLRTKAGSKRGILFTKGDVLFGKLRPYLKNILYAEFDGVAVGDFWVLRSDKIEPKLLYVLVNSNNFMKVANISSGSKMPRADWNLVSSTKFYIPQSKDEQRALATFFTSLDNQISAAEKRLASLKQVKAASLQAMFPQEGETTPKLRFKGCEGEWKKVKLGDVFEHLKNNSLSRDNLATEGFVMNIHYGDVLIKYGECIDTCHDEIPYIKDEKLGKAFWNTEALQSGDIIMADAAEDNTVGKCSELITDNAKVVSGLHTIAIRPKKKFASCYLGYYMNSPCYHNQLLRHIQGSKISSITKKAVDSTYTHYPNEESEQCQIASYFTALDRQISAQSSKISKLKQIKSACLDQMFV